MASLEGGTGADMYRVNYQELFNKKREEQKIKEDRETRDVLARQVSVDEELKGKSSDEMSLLR